MENTFNNKIECFESDGGGELDNKVMVSHFSKCDIIFRKSCPDTPQQNGVAERKHQHILEMVLPRLICNMNINNINLILMTPKILEKEIK